MEAKFKQVTLSDFNMAALKKAAREGRLFIKPSSLSPEEVRERSLNEILQYVGRIDSCASPQYACHIRELWHEILLYNEIADSLITTRGKHEGQPNWYHITSLVTYLLEKEVYRKHEFTIVSLHLKMEQITKRNNHYTGSSTFYLNSEQRNILKCILKKFHLKSAEK